MYAQQRAAGLARRSTFDMSKLDRLDDAELDELPYGVVCLDSNGTILRYNLAEARLARLDRNDVIGRHFFEEVAPCTRTEEFHGRFEAHVEAGEEQLTRFPYLFDFKFGAQQVDVELYTVPNSRRHYLLINRMEFRAPREDRGGRRVAPLQGELKPAEAEPGVRRNLRAERIAEIGVPFVEALLRSASRLPDATRYALLHDWGLQWGRRAMVELDLRAQEETGEGLREHSVEEAVRRVHASLRDAGWGELSVDFTHANRGVVHCRLDDSLLASAARARGRHGALIAGYLEAAFSHLAGRRLHAHPIPSTDGAGEGRDELLVVGPRRDAALREAMNETRSLEEWVDALGRPESE